EEVRHLELRDEAVRYRVLPRALDELRAALEADDRGTAARNRQREIAEAAEEVRDALAGLRIEQLDGACHQLPVTGVVDLREIGRPKAQAHAEVGKRIVELALARLEGLRGLGTPGLEPEMDAVLARKGAQVRLIRVGQRLEVAQHQRCGV